MNDDVLLQGSGRKLRASLDIFFASIEAYIDFDPARTYTPKELEPYDALSDRYLRAFESSIRYFRTLERFREVAPRNPFATCCTAWKSTGRSPRPGCGSRCATRAIASPTNTCPKSRPNSIAPSSDVQQPSCVTSGAP